MRKFLGLLFAGAMVVGVAGSAQAATLGASGTLALSLSTLPPVVVPGSGTISVSSGTGGFTETPGLFGPANVPLPKSLFTGVPQISGLTLSNFGNGTMVVNGSLGTAAGGLAGSAVVTILQSLNLTIPLSVVGNSGATVQAGAGAIIITVKGQGWTTGTAVVTGVTTTTPGGNVVNTATSMGSEARTASHQGALTLVTGFQAITNVAGTLPGFVVQSLTFVPEPGTLLLLGSGAIGLALYGRRRMRK